MVQGVCMVGGAACVVGVCAWLKGCSLGGMHG